MMRQIPRIVVQTTLALFIAMTGAVTADPAFAAVPASVPQHVAGGALPGMTHVAAQPRAGVSALDVVPASASLRTLMPPVGDQGQIGSCVAWSIGYALMGYYANLTQAPGAPYAPLYLYMRTVDPGGAPTHGLYPPDALALATAGGVDTQVDYTQGTTGWRTPPTAAQIANATKYKVAGWKTLWSGYPYGQGPAAQTAIKQAIAAGSPVAIDFPVFPDFFNIHSSALYTTTSGVSQGGHMVAAYGYDSEGIWIRNSWGTYWGAAGDAHLSWAFVNAKVWDAYTITGLQISAKPTVPTITGLSVANVSTLGGTTVTVTGANLTGVTAVKVGALAGTGVKVLSPTTLSFVTPAATAGAVHVTVTGPAGTSATSDADLLTFVKPPVPALTSLSPASGLTTAVTSVTVTGANLGDVTRVTAGGTSIAFAKVSSTQLKLTLPAHAAGAVDIVATSAAGASPAARFTYVAPPVPAVTALSPATGVTNVATTVTLTGTNIGGATRVAAGSASLAFTRVSDTQLTVVLPPHAAGTVTIQVTTPGGVSVATSTAARFNYQAPAARR
jgi:Papain family cysteine protease/IPT/TIG domain